MQNLEIREAGPEDNAALIELQARCPQGTAIRLNSVNTPDFFARASGYPDFKVFNAYYGGELVGSGAGAIQPVRVDGIEAKSGYEFQYFIDPAHRHQGIARRLRLSIEDYFRSKDVAFAYAFIVDKNLPSMSLFARQGFRLFKKLKMQVILPYRKMEIPAGAMLRAATPQDYPEIARLLNQTWEKYNLYRPTTGQELGELLGRLPGYQHEDLLVREEGGEIIACLGSWDWQKITQVKIISYDLSLRLIGTALNVARLVRPMPSLPKPGSPLKQWSLIPLGFESVEALTPLLYAVNNRALAANLEQVVNICDPACPVGLAMKGLFKADATMQMYVKPLKEGFSLADRPTFVSSLDI